MKKTYGFKREAAMRYATESPMQKIAFSGKVVESSAALSYEEYFDDF